MNLGVSGMFLNPAGKTDCASTRLPGLVAKIQFFLPESNLQTSRWMQSVFSQEDLKTLQTDLGSLALSCRGNVMEQPYGGCLDFPWECGRILWAQGATEK